MKDYFILNNGNKIINVEYNQESSNFKIDSYKILKCKKRNTSNKTTLCRSYSGEGTASIDGYIIENI